MSGTAIALLADGQPGPSFTAIVESASRAASALVGDAARWWRVPSTSLLTPAVLGAHTALRPVLLLVLTASVLTQSIRIVVMRRGEPLFAVFGGLIRFAVAAALGITLLQGALWAGDVLAANLLATGGAPGAVSGAEAFGATMREALTARRGGLAEPFLLLLLSVVVLLLAAAQWMAMALRQVALLAVAATLPLAAAGSLTATTRGWLSRLMPWAAAMVIYKPAAALVHAVGQQYLGQLDEPGGNDVGMLLAGVVVLVLGVAALPLSLRLLSWTSVRVTAGVSGEAMAGARGAVRLGSLGYASPSVRLASFMENAGPGSHRLVTGAAPASSSAAFAGAIAGPGPGPSAGLGPVAGAPGDAEPVVLGPSPAEPPVEPRPRQPARRSRLGMSELAPRVPGGLPRSAVSSTGGARP
jgi:type IV secretion system protein TrbL